MTVGMQMEYIGIRDGENEIEGREGRRSNGHPGLTPQAENATAFCRGRFVSCATVVAIFEEEDVR